MVNVTGTLHGMAQEEKWQFAEATSVFRSEDMPMEGRRFKMCGVPGSERAGLKTGVGV